MVVFVDDDGAYRSWVAHHRGGYVLDGLWKRELTHLRLHRATCEVVRGRGAKHSHLTTGGRFKAYGATCDEWVDWAVQRTGSAPEACPECRPDHSPVDQADAPHKLSRLATSVLDYVLDVAVIHLDDPSLRYRLTVADVARCFGKSTAQLHSTLTRLIDDGMIAVAAPISRSPRSADQRLVLPTAAALRTLPDFSSLNPEELANQIAILESP